MIITNDYYFVYCSLISSLETDEMNYFFFTKNSLEQEYGRVEIGFKKNLVPYLTGVFYRMHIHN